MLVNEISFLIVCTICIYFGHESAPETFVRADDHQSIADQNILDAADGYLREICSNYFGCQPGSANPNNDIFSQCCIDCNCNPNCSDTHSCCPESNSSLTGPRPYLSSRNDSVCRDTVIKGESTNILLYPEYEFIQSCSVFTDNLTKVYCEDMEKTAKSEVISANVPMYDQQQKINYRNIYCARCNNATIENLLIWQPKLICDRLTDLQIQILDDNTGLDQVVQENNCLVSFLPPNSVSNILPCYTDVIVDCNVTGNWITYNHNDDLFCRTVDLLYVSVPDKKTKYKNIFCARCNGEHVHVLLLDSCPLKGPNNYGSSLETLLRYTLADIELTTSDTDTSSVTPRSCPRTYEFDPLSGDCMPVHCSTPLHFDIASLTCTVFYESVNNGRCFHGFKLTFQDAVSISEAQTITEKIYTRTEVDPELRECHVGVFYQTNITNSTDLMQDGRQTNLMITGIFLTVHAFVFEGNLTAHYAMENKQLASYLNESNASVFGSDVFDPKLLDYGIIGEPMLIKLPTENFTFSNIGNFSHYWFHNPFDKTVFIGHLDNRFKGISTCEPNVYKEDFLGCSSFVYELEPNFQRVPTGLSVAFGNKNILFSFGEFKTFNSSMVRICKEAVLERTRSVSVASITTRHWLVSGIQLYLGLYTLSF